MPYKGTAIFGRSMVIGIDFDGTCVPHRFPYIKGENPHAVEVLKELVEVGHKLVLITMRHTDPVDDVENPLQDAVDWFAKHGIPLYGINENPQQKHWSKSRKIYCDLYIDDQFLGVPLTMCSAKRSMVDWVEVRKLLYTMNVL